MAIHEWDGAFSGIPARRNKRRGSTMLQEEYVRLAKSVDNISAEQAKQIIGTVLDKLKAEARAIIVDVWTREPGQGGVDILVPYLRRSDPQVPGPQNIALTEKATGVLVWVAETRKPVWL